MSYRCRPWTLGNVTVSVVPVVSLLHVSMKHFPSKTVVVDNISGFGAEEEVW